MTSVERDVASAGMPVTAPDPVEVSSVYVHAPFCVRRCVYCDFAVSVDRDPSPEPWLDALAGELAALRDEGRAALASPLSTLYVGGGTPSLLGATAMVELRRILGASRLDDPGLEWTAEANPESFDPEVAGGWRRGGVNRVSLGVQSFQESALRWMGRLHGPRGARTAVSTARAAGFDSVSVDLIFGLPSSVERDWRADLEAAVGLGVPHISLYGLTAERNTPLGRAVDKGRVAMPDQERYADEYLLAHELLAAEGFHAYEVSNFAREGHESRHNRAYWEGRAYLGLGNGAHGYLPPMRRWNLRDWEAYASATTEGRLPVAGYEVVEGVASRLELIWLGLRTDAGLGQSWFASARARDLRERWIRSGLVRSTNEGVVATPEGWLVLDRLAVELDEAVEDPDLRIGRPTRR